MTRAELIAQIKQKRSFLCVGLDPDIEKMPERFRQEEDPLFAFNKYIIDATAQYAVAYKPNLAFYEVHGTKGWQALEKTANYIPPNCFKIADAKRGDIGNTGNYYARAFYNTLGFHAITVAPYMGSDSVTPFTAHHGKWAILLALTSNPGAADLQLPNQLYQTVLTKAQQWGTPENLMFVVGATKAEYIKQVRAIAPNHFLLVPGVGAQGGSLQEVCTHGFAPNAGLLINSSRGIIYANDPAQTAREMQQEMQTILQEKGLL